MLGNERVEYNRQFIFIYLPLWLIWGFILSIVASFCLGKFLTMYSSGRGQGLARLTKVMTGERRQGTAEHWMLASGACDTEMKGWMWCLGKTNIIKETSLYLIFLHLLDLPFFLLSFWIWFCKLASWCAFYAFTPFFLVNTAQWATSILIIEKTKTGPTFLPYFSTSLFSPFPLPIGILQTSEE